MTHKRRSSLQCMLNPKNMLCLPVNNIGYERDIGEAENEKSPSNVSTSKHTKTTNEEIQDSVVYVDLVRENDRNLMVSDDLSINVEEFPAYINLPPSEV